MNNFINNNKKLILSILLLIFLYDDYATGTYTSYRLPKSFHPENYKLEVHTHLNDSYGFKYFGKVWITTICDEDATNITLHSKNLTILEKELSIRMMPEENAIGNDVKIKKIEYLKENDYLVLHTDDSMKKGRKYEVYIPFEAELSTGLLGYYRSSYYDKESQSKIWLSVTQFEPTHARQAFPCFDEPEMKATFDIILGHHKKYTALSNMPVSHTEKSPQDSEWIIDYFNRTVPMSTYLVAYTINDFEYKEAEIESSEDVVFRIWARRDAINQTDYATIVGPNVTKFYEDYFDIKFPLPKIDMIAIPDFSAGAMENWGLITYRETALLYLPNVSTTSSKYRVASVIAHELAHQWFGNLVTMKWWTDLWLNEGFATYIASLGVHHLHPEWNSLDENTVDNMLSIFKFDALKTSHPVSVEIGHPSMIAQIFDAISYQKGSNVLRMMHSFLGEDTFRSGVSRYLKKHAYKNAIQDDLWASLTEVAHENDVLPKHITVKMIMDSWTLQTGYPVINVTRDYSKNTADISQMRYVADATSSKSLVENCWWVPLTYTDKISLAFNETMARDWLECSKSKDPENATKTLTDLPDRNNWLVFNNRLSGLYKVQYDKDNYRLIVNQLIGPDFRNIDVMNRAQLIDDAMDLAWTQNQEYGIALSMINYLRQEDEYIPWKSALSNLNIVSRLLKRTQLYGVFKSYMQHILDPIYQTVGGMNPDEVKSERLDAVKRKVLIASWACRYDVSDCVEKSLRYFYEWMKVENPDTTNPIPLDLRSIVYCNAMKYRKENEWNFLWQRYLNSNVQSEKTLIIIALSCSREIWLLQRYLDWSLNSTSGVRKQDATILFGGVAKGDVGFNLAKDFLLNRIDEIYNYLSPDTSRITRYIKPLAEYMSTEKELLELKDLVDKKPKLFEKSTQGVSQALETIEVNQQWRRTNYQEMGRYLGRMAYRDFQSNELLF
uniref:Aminopeptidase n=1 Tax=Corethrella appendiculata TaxID=1370023 RepID=U5EU86_9DIPT